MNLCNDDHDEVCYEGRKCPLCDMRDTKDAEIGILNDKVNELEGEIRSLEDGRN